MESKVETGKRTLQESSLNETTERNNVTEPTLRSKKRKKEILELKDFNESDSGLHRNFKATILYYKESDQPQELIRARAAVSDGTHATFIYCKQETLAQQLKTTGSFTFTNLKVVPVKPKYQVHGYLKYEFEFKSGSLMSHYDVDVDGIRGFPDDVYTKLCDLPGVDDNYVNCRVVVKRKFQPKYLENSRRWCRKFLVCDDSLLETTVELFSSEEDYGDEFVNQVLVLDRVKKYVLWHKIFLQGAKFSHVDSMPIGCEESKWSSVVNSVTKPLFEDFVATPVSTVDECSVERPLVTVGVVIADVRRGAYLGCPKPDCHRQVVEDTFCKFCQCKVECEEIIFITLLTHGSNLLVRYFLHESDEEDTEYYKKKEASVVVKWNPELLIAVRIDIKNNNESRSDEDNTNNRILTSAITSVSPAVTSVSPAIERMLSVDETELFDDYTKLVCGGPPRLTDLLSGISKRNVPQKQDEYAMKNNPHGKVVIINNKFFVNFERREGTEHDGYNLEQLFIKFGFNVTVENDKSAQAIVDIIEQERLQDHSCSDAFILVVLSHGTKDFVYGADDKSVAINRITDAFDGDSCPTLQGKPKIFFIQACQGDLNSYVVRDDSLERNGEPGSDVRDVGVDFAVQKHVNDRRQTSAARHEKADMLIAHSTVRDYASWRLCDRGSCFVRSLVYVFAKFAHDKHLMDMLTKVKGLMSDLKIEGDKNRINLLPEDLNRLTKKVYFHPE